MIKSISYMNMKESDKLFERLRSIKLENIEMLQEIEVLCKNIDDTNIIEPLFFVFENNPNFDFGNPGNLIRIVEKFYLSPIYEEELYKSVKRKPTEYNLWMINRLLNTFSEEKKLKGIELFKKIIDNPAISKEIRDTAQVFLDEQTE